MTTDKVILPYLSLDSVAPGVKAIPDIGLAFHSLPAFPLTNDAISSLVMEEPEVPMILPKGIVVNTPNIYDEVAKCPRVPTDKAWEYWRVYTTTNKKLQDPTARRLENFWWHVMGSDRQHLSGHVLAKLYEDISLGPTFVPLRGPPNRWEGPDVPSITQIQLEKREQSTSQASGATMSSPNMRMSKDLSSSALRPPPPHPILKKPRGPSASGPRPTARFVSPHVSGDEEENQDDIPSSGSTITPGLEMRAAIKSPPKKKVTAANRKFVASAGKRRPALARKGSSNSGSSGTGSKEGGASTSGIKSPKSPKSPRSFPRVISPVEEVLSTLSNGPSPASQETPKLSAKALGKRPAVPRNAKFEPKYCQKQPESPEAQSVSPSTALPPRSSSITPTQPSKQKQTQALTPKRPEQRQTVAPLTRHLSLVELPSQSEINREAVPKPGNINTDSASRFNNSIGSVPMAPSRSHSGFVRRERGINHGLFTGATASTTNIAAQGTIIDQSGGVGPVAIPSPYEQQPYDEMSMSPSSSLLASRLTPTQPSTAASVPLGRTRSQLTLLLERGNEQSRKKSWY